MNNIDLVQEAPTRKTFLPKITLSNAISISPPKLLATIQQEWPSAFGEPPKPLAIGITSQIVCGLDVDWRAGLIAHCIVSIVLGAWTRSPRYLANLQAGSPRYALDGSVHGRVTGGDESHARCILQEIEEHGHPISWGLELDWQIRSARRLWKKL
jgi:sRNA-binding protein